MDLKEETKPLGLDSAIGRVSRMDYINNKSVNEASLCLTQNTLVALEQWLSLSEIDKCGNAININRLLLMSESSLYIQCASRR